MGPIGSSKCPSKKDSFPMIDWAISIPTTCPRNPLLKPMVVTWPASFQWAIPPVQSETFNMHPGVDSSS
eukprot:7179745-Prorocentrum_lima.AAC.1